MIDFVVKPTSPPYGGITGGRVKVVLMSRTNLYKTFLNKSMLFVSTVMVIELAMQTYNQLQALSLQ